MFYLYLVVLTVKVESRIILIIVRVKVKSKMASPYHFIGQNPHKYEYSDGTKRISSLSVDIKELYPPGFVEKHGDNAKNMLLSLSYVLDIHIYGTAMRHILRKGKPMV